jgi:hypothetical protein
MCKEGLLVPLSDDYETYSLWICNMPQCAYAISKDAAGDTYYKGVAAAEPKKKGDKEWTEFRF